MAADQVRIQLSTRHADIEFPESTGPILVSTDLKRYALSTLVNSLLESTSPIPFEFLINGEFLRISLNEFLTERGISAETTLNVEYTRAQLPPTTQASFEHDDWVGAVDVLSNSSPAGVWSAQGVRSGHERIASGSYDGLLRVWDLSGNILATSSASMDLKVSHVFATKFTSPSSIVTANWTRLQLWNYTDSDTSSNASLTPSLELIGHTLCVMGLAVHGPTQRILSASDDTTAALWSSDLTDSSQPPVPSNLVPSHPSNKRRKTGASTPAPVAGPLSILRGHTRPVTASIFHPRDPTVAYTTSRDHSFRTWDLVTSACVTTRTPLAHTGLTSICGLQELSLVALGTEYNNISTASVLLVDPREGGSSGQKVVMSLKGHRSDISSLASNPSSTYGLVSGSYDGTCRVWDARNSRGGNGGGVGLAGKTGQASFRIPRKGSERCDEVVGGKGVKVFDVVWDSDVGIVSGSEDRTVQVDKT